MRMFKYILSFSLVSLLAVSCFENDMSLPRILAQFTKFEVEGGLETVIDTDNRTVSLVIDEVSELAQLKVSNVELNEKAYFTDGKFPEVIDLTSPMDVMLSMYQNYDWTISAVQPVERYVYCANQIGEAIVKESERTVEIYISQSQRLNKLVVNKIKLERVGSVVKSTSGVEIVDPQSGRTELVTRDCEFPMTLDFNSPRQFNVEFQGNTYTWTVTAVPVEVAAEIKGIDARCYYAEVIATYGGGENPVPVFE